MTKATIKSYTDLEQSNKLAEILPLESADMCYPLPYEEGDKPLLEQGGFGSIPCWSLAALLDLIPEYIKFNEHTWKFYLDHRGMYYMNADTYDTNAFSSDTGILINDAYEIILKLKEKKLL